MIPLNIKKSYLVGTNNVRLLSLFQMTVSYTRAIGVLQNSTRPVSQTFLFNVEKAVRRYCSFVPLEPKLLCSALRKIESRVEEKRK